MIHKNVVLCEVTELTLWALHIDKQRRNRDLEPSSIRYQSAANNIAPGIPIQDIIIQIHKLKHGHEVRDAPDRGTPLRPGDRVVHFRRVQVETNRRR